MDLEVCASSGSAQWSGYGQDEMSWHIHPIPCTWDAVTTCTQVTISFHLGCGYAQKEIRKKKKTEHIMIHYFHMHMRICRMPHDPYYVIFTYYGKNVICLLSVATAR